MKLLLVVLGLVGVCAAGDFRGTQVFKVAKEGKGIIDQLINQDVNAGFDYWSGKANDMIVLVPKGKVQSFKDLLSKNRIRYEVVIKDLATAKGKDLQDIFPKN